jgi:hypothetical protein
MLRHSLHGRLHGWARGLAALLLALQALAGGAVALAHAADTQRGPVALESGHNAQCVTLHDAARCAQCRYQATRTLPAVTRRAPFTVDHTSAPVATRQPGAVRRTSAPPHPAHLQHPCPEMRPGP